MQKKIMVLGTSSGAGKSLITTGLCRLFYNDGYSVVPFKAQNMSRNSYELGDGRKIAIAQVLQAYSCYLEPKPWMNPLLLIPKGNGQIEVVLEGEHFINTTGERYLNEKEEYKKYLVKAYENTKSFDICVLEGAGSPVEINIKDKDIVNMGMAKLVKSPTILVGDIHRGGVFASIVGTYVLLSEEEKTYLKGYIINKYSGKKESLEKGLIEVERLTGLKCLGIVPLENIDIEDEDGLISKRDTKEILERCGDLSLEEYRDREFSKLEKLLRDNLDMDSIYNILKDGI